MPDSARSGSLHDSAASNVEQDQEQNNERADHNDANEERRADAGIEEQGDEHEAGAPPPKSVDLTAAKSEVELLTAQLATQGAILAQQRALFHQLQQGAATSAPISASGSMMGLNAELASHENAQGGSDATTDPAATEPAPGTNHQYHHQGSPMHPPNPFPYAPHPPYATQTAQALQQAHMGQQALAEERAARLAAERIAEQLSYMMQQEAWGRTALEDRIVTGSKDLEQLRQAASRYWTEAQDTLTTQTTSSHSCKTKTNRTRSSGRN